MHLTVSMLIECHFTGDDFDGSTKKFEEYVEELVLMQRLAGGLIIGIGRVEFIEPPEEPQEWPKFIRQEMRKLLPGFLLVERSDLLAEHVARLRESNPKAEIVDAWLDFIALKHQAQSQIDENVNKDIKVEWDIIPKPAGGWLIPITTGYRAISELYSPGQVKNTRNSNVPFRFVESVYTVGQWLSPHRIKNWKDIFWQYHAESDSGWYLCKNSYFPLENTSVHEKKLQKENKYEEKSAQDCFSIGV